MGVVISKGKISLMFIFGFISLGITVIFLIMNSKPTPGSCRILEEKYCKKLVLINFPGSNFKIAAVNLPVGTKVYSPINGESQWGKMPVVKDSYPSRDVSIQFENRLGVIKANFSLSFFDNDNKYFTNSPKSVQEGEIIGTVSDEKLTEFGNYNLVIVTNDRSSTDKKMLQKNSEKLLLNTLNIKFNL